METLNYMDPKERRRQSRRLMFGYALVGCAVVLMSLVLLFVAYGFGYKDGEVIQNGLIFLSSTPHPAQVYLDGTLYKSTTNARLVLPAGTYGVDLKRSGYRDWRRSITVAGGQVESYVYPFLFPAALTTTTRQTYVSAPAFVTQSLDRRWLLVARPASLTSYDLYDLNNSKQVPVVLNLPSGLLSPGTTQSISVVGWAGDNTHVLLAHTYDGKTEYILVSRTAPEQSTNLTKLMTLPTTHAEVRFNNAKYDQYLVFDTASHMVSRATLNAPQLVQYLTNVLAYDAYGTNIALYATPDPTDKTKVDINYTDGGIAYTIRRAAADTTYALHLSSYGGKMYVAMAAGSENVAYVYENPAAQIANARLGVAVPADVFSITAPDFVTSSPNGQYIAFEHGTDFAVYDAENLQGFSYSVPTAMDKPQTHAAWMDGARLAYVSNGQLVVFDNDGQNRQTLVPADPDYPPVFDPSYKFVYTLEQSSGDKANELFTSTSLRTLADQ